MAPAATQPDTEARRIGSLKLAGTQQQFLAGLGQIQIERIRAAILGRGGATGEPATLQAVDEGNSLRTRCRGLPPRSMRKQRQQGVLGGAQPHFGQGGDELIDDRKLSSAQHVVRDCGPEDRR